MELVDILDATGKSTYTFTSRYEAHLQGLWHRNVGLLISYKELEVNYLIFSERSQAKKSFPGLLDITASGHLSKGEVVEAGCREFVEELGSTSLLEGLVYLDDFKLVNTYKLENKVFLNREHLSLYHKKVLSLDNFTLDTSEIARFLAINFADLSHLISGTPVPTYNYDGSLHYLKNVTLEDFLPSDSFYMENIIKMMMALP